MPIESTLLLLQHRLKARHDRPAIEVIKQYGHLPEVPCYPGQLNQVFMNILANAADVLDEVAQTQSFEEWMKNPPQITIRTEKMESAVQIQIQDNGKGMTEDIKSRIFDHLFTTKEVGKGTGLGLAIARQIVEEKHQGTITINSAPGGGSEFVIALPIYYLGS